MMKQIICGILLTMSLSIPVPLIAQQEDDFGVLVMAHGGTPEWNQGVLDTVAPLSNKHNLEVAFGMADAASLQDAVAKLEKRGAKRIAVVRLFISGESWFERTEQILGISEGAPEREITHEMRHDHSSSHSDHVLPDSEIENSATVTSSMSHSMEFWKINSNSRFAMSKSGLAQAQEMGEVLLTRAQALSKNPSREDILILAHGPGEDAENLRWLEYINARADIVRKAHQFRNVKVATLREDWEEKRINAEQEVKDFVANAKATNGTAIVIPYRVHGFGPYAKVLEGLDYVADEKGLIPHDGVTQWIAAQIAQLSTEL